MCEQCIEVDKDIARYTELSGRTTDQLALDVITAILSKLQSRKLGLHPEWPDLRVDAVGIVEQK
jgi:hypothetical protein